MELEDWKSLVKEHRASKGLKRKSRTTGLTKTAATKQFAKALRAGDLQEIEDLILAGADLNKWYAVLKGAPLHWAMANGNRQVLEMLVKNGVDVTGADDQRFDAVLTAIENNNYDLVEFFLEHGNIKWEEVEVQKKYVEKILSRGPPGFAWLITKKCDSDPQAFFLLCEKLDITSDEIFNHFLAFFDTKDASFLDKKMGDVVLIDWLHTLFDLMNKKGGLPPGWRTWDRPPAKIVSALMLREITSGNIKNLCKMIDMGWSISVLKEKGLVLAILNGQTEMLSFFLKSPLFCTELNAVLKNRQIGMMDWFYIFTNMSFQKIKACCEFGIEWWNIKNTGGENPLHRILRYANVETAKEYVEGFFEMDMQHLLEIKNTLGATPMDELYGSCTSDQAQDLRSLYESLQLKKITSQTIKGSTPLKRRL